jgi:hypothetical protein
VKRFVLVVALLAAPVLADDVYLRGGGQITGQIIEQTKDSVTVDVGGGKLTVQMSSVVRIEQSQSPLQQYRERAKAIPPDDAGAWRELARWARGEALATMAEEAWHKVTAILPDDPEANAALGKVQVNGRWVTEEESYAAQGYVKFEGEWMTPNEKQAILQERKVNEQAYQQAEAARMQAEDKAEEAKKAQEEIDRQNFMHGGLPQYGTSSDVVYWGWGTGPTVWPSSSSQSQQSANPGGGSR